MTHGDALARVTHTTIKVFKTEILIVLRCRYCNGLRIEPHNTDLEKSAFPDKISTPKLTGKASKYC
jgi:hypothetical protein